MRKYVYLPRRDPSIRREQKQCEWSSSSCLFGSFLPPVLFLCWCRCLRWHCQQNCYWQHLGFCLLSIINGSWPPTNLEVVGVSPPYWFPESWTSKVVADFNVPGAAVAVRKISILSEQLIGSGWNSCCFCCLVRKAASNDRWPFDFSVYALLLYNGTTHGLHF